MLKIIKKRDILNEALGVPDNLPQTADMIYNDILKNISPNYDFNKLNGLEKLISGNYRVGDYRFDKFNFKLTIEEEEEFHLLSMGSGAEMEMGKEERKNIGRVGKVSARYFQSGRDLRLNNPYGFDLSIIFSAPKQIRGEHIIKYFLYDRDNIRKIIGHELMHLYDFHKNKKKDINKQVKSLLSQESLSIDIPSIAKFKEMLYFVNSNENVVRMSEIGTGIVLGQITKKEFLKKLEKDNTIQALRLIKDYSFSDFKNDLLNDKEEIVEFLSDNNIIDDFVRLIINNSYQQYLSIVMGIFAQLFISGERKILTKLIDSGSYTDEEKEEINKKHKRQTLNIGKTGEQYFENMIKFFNIEAEKVLRKIFKLYAMAKDVPNPKIPNVMKKMKTESKWINLDHWDKFMKSQKDRGNMKIKDGIMKGYIY